MTGKIIKNARIFSGEKIVENGYIEIKEGVINDWGEGTPPHSDSSLDLKGRSVMPGVVDCHTHLLEFGALGAQKCRGKAQKLGGFANLTKALQAGITTVGEHFLGHPALNQNLDEYREIILKSPINILLCLGWCVIGTEPLTFLSSHFPGRVIEMEDVTGSEIDWMADNTGFPGESIFVNATVANLPPEAAPNGGKEILDFADIKEIVERFNKKNKKLGAHVEGETSIRNFIEAGGKVLHHGHGITRELMEEMRIKGVEWVITPHGGTSSPPTTPDEIALALKIGLKPALASDSYLPVHPEAFYLISQNLRGKEIGPGEFLHLIYNLSQELLKRGVKKEEILRMLTIYPARIMGIEKENGSIKAGKKADLIIAQGLWGVEINDPEDIDMVIKDGEPVIDRF